MTQKVSPKISCCSDIKNLPEEMEEAIRLKGGVDGIKSQVPERSSLRSEAELFHTLSDPIRLQILHALLIVDLCPCVLKEITELSDSKLSYHLNILEKAGLISSSPRKKWRIYMLTDRGRFHINEASVENQNPE
ncbi:MAG: metalloregulator ArsR/SmtB family transcription factor [Methanomassiliicoccales archaeon]|jgi:ArsR family transcriptional regulator